MLLIEKAHRPKRGRLRAGPLLRVRVVLSRLRLDRALASGADPVGSPELELRSQQLQRRRTRERLARAMHRLLVIAFDDPRRHVGPARVPFRHQRVRPNGERFEALAETLTGPGPHTVRGLAMASNLLEDGRGELYANDTPGDLGRALDAIIAALQVEGPPNGPVSRPTAGEPMELAGVGSSR
jgi:hypothetical protein